MYNQSKHKERKHFGMYCLQCFKLDRILEKHTNNCLIINGKQSINMPKEGENILKYNNFYNQQAVPFVIYGDFEAVTKKFKVVNLTMINHTQKPIRLMKTVVMEKIVCCYKNKFSKPIQIYRGENAVYKFMKKMLEVVEYCEGIVKKRFNKPLKMTENDELCFKLMDGCHICGKKCTDKDVRVRDYCHITGK